MEPLAYTAQSIDRAVDLRADETRTQALLTNGAARIAPVWNQRHPFVGTAPVFIPHETAKPLAADAPFVFLGLMDATPWFAVGIKGDEPPTVAANAEYRLLNEVAPLMPGAEASLLAYARAFVIWHENHRHCGRCGAACASTESGHSRTCTNTACAHRTFPRTDPVVITLVTRGDQCLLGRQAAWPQGMFSAIAGFVEPAETVEAAVAREMAEETGVRVTNVTYVTSQPWPFPASLMLGFRADATTTDIRRADKELEDCRWFTRAEVLTFSERDAPGTGFKMPGRYAIARLLLDRWLAE